MAKNDHGPSIKDPDTYESLREKGYDKSKAAAIANIPICGHPGTDRLRQLSAAATLVSAFCASSG